MLPKIYLRTTFVVLHLVEKEGLEPPTRHIRLLIFFTVRLSVMMDYALPTELLLNNYFSSEGGTRTRDLKIMSLLS